MKARHGCHVGQVQPEICGRKLGIGTRESVTQRLRVDRPLEPIPLMATLPWTTFFIFTAQFIVLYILLKGHVLRRPREDIPGFLVYGSAVKKY